MKRFFAPIAAPALALAAGAGTAHAELLYATNGSAISRFDSRALGSVTSVPVTGLFGETLVDIDSRSFSPDEEGQANVYGVGSDSRLYILNVITGNAIMINRFSPTLNGAAFGIDFDPAADRLRVVSDTDQNLRLNPTPSSNGTTLAEADANLHYIPTGPNPYVVSIAYASDRSPAPTLYGLDCVSGNLVRMGGPDGSAPSPNYGELSVVGSLGLGTNLNQNIGFDISRNNAATPPSRWAAVPDCIRST